MSDYNRTEGEHENLEKSLEEARREKVEKFKVNFGDDFFGNTVSDDISSRSSTGNNTDAEVTQSYDSDGGLYSTGSDFFSDDLNKSENEIASCSSEGALHQYTNEEIKQREKALKEAKRAEKKRRKIKAKKNSRLFLIIRITMILVVGITLGKFGLIGASDFLAIERTDNATVSVKLPKNASIGQISDILEKNGVIDNSFFFEVYARLTKSDSGFRQGEYEIAKNKDYEAIINFLQSNTNRKDIVTIQFSEGMSVESIAKKLSDEGVCSYDDFLRLCRSDVFDEDYDFLSEIDTSKRYYKLEGYLFPDTYDFYIGEDAQDTISRFLANFKNKCLTTKTKIENYDKRVNIRRRAELKGYTLDEIINLASIIQKESADKDDMYLVSSVFHNRLKTGENGGYSDYNEYNLYLFQSEAVYYYMEKLPSAFKKFFDTDKNGGLPGGPICNPGMDAIEAALEPDDTNYYYFCHKTATEDEPAEAYYASTLSEHNINLAKLPED